MKMWPKPWRLQAARQTKATTSSLPAVSRSASRDGRICCIRCILIKPDSVLQRRGKHFCFPLCFFLLVLFFFVFSLLVLLPSGCCFCMLFLLFLFVFCFFLLPFFLSFLAFLFFFVFSFSLFRVFFCFCFFLALLFFYAFSFLLSFPFSFSHFSLSFYSPCFFFLFILFCFFFTSSFGFARPFRRFSPIVSAVLFCNEVFASVDRFDFDFPAIKLRQTAVCAADFHVVTHHKSRFWLSPFSIAENGRCGKPAD